MDMSLIKMTAMRIAENIVELSIYTSHTLYHTRVLLYV